MSIVTGLINGIQQGQLNNALTSSIDLNDPTFAELLDNQIGLSNNNFANSLGNMGIPSGFEINAFSGAENIESLPQVSETQNCNANQQEDVTTSETITFFKSIFDTSTPMFNNHSKLFDFAQKHALNLYNKGAGSVITDVNEFVTDVLHS